MGRIIKKTRVNAIRFSSYLFRVLKQVHPELTMTKTAMHVMDDFMHDIFRRLVDEAAALVKVSKKSTLTSSEIQTATKLVLPGELSKHAINDATKAVATFIKSRANDQPKLKTTSIPTFAKNGEESMGIPMEKNVSSTDSAAEIAKVVEDVDMNEVNNQHVDLIEETGKSSRSDQLNDEKVVSMPEKPRQEEHFQMKTHESAMDNRGEPMDFTLRSEDACLGLRSNDDLNDTLEAGSEISREVSSSVSDVVEVKTVVTVVCTTLNGLDPVHPVNQKVTSTTLP